MKTKTLQTVLSVFLPAVLLVGSHNAFSDQVIDPVSYGAWVSKSVDDLDGYLASDAEALSSFAPELTDEPKKKWKLKTIVLGIRAGVELGLGDWKVGALPRFRLELRKGVRK